MSLLRTIGGLLFLCAVLFAPAPEENFTLQPTAVQYCHSCAQCTWMLAIDNLHVKLGSDITWSNRLACIVVLGKNTVFDGNGYTMTYTGSGNASVGIVVGDIIENRFLGGNNARIHNHRIVNAPIGMMVLGASNVTLAHNIVEGSVVGISILPLDIWPRAAKSQSTTIFNNTIDSTGIALKMKNTYNNRIMNNTFLAGPQYTILLDNADNNTFVYNDIGHADFFLALANSESENNRFSIVVGNKSHGNKWADIHSLAIYDTDADGFGDTGPQYPYAFINGANVSENVVDYGPMTAIVDLPPQAGVVYDLYPNGLPEADVSNNASYLGAMWENFTDDWGIVAYSVSFGTSPGAADVVPETVVGTDTVFNTSAVLSHGQTYYATVRGCDRLGRCVSAYSDGVLIDLVPPHVKISLPVKRYFQNPMYYWCRATDDYGLQSIQLLIFNATGGIVFSSVVPVSGTSAEASWTISLPDGTYTSVCVGKDEAGNRNESEVVEINVDNQPPYVYFVSPTPANNTNVTTPWVYVNVSVFDVFPTSAWLDWNGTLLAAWTFDDTNETAVMDTSRNGRHAWFGSGVNASNIVDGKFGKGMVFDGIDDQLNNISLPPALRDPWTVVAWVKTTNKSAGMILTNRHTEQQRSVSLHIGYFANTPMNDGKAYFTFDGPYCQAGAVSTTDIADGKWHLIVGVRENASTFKIYVDGVLEGVNNKYVSYSGENCSAGVANSTAPWIIGNAPAWNGARFKGAIDELRVYSRALSQQEILAAYNNSKYQLENNFTGLSYWNSYTYTAYAIDAAGRLGVNGTRIVHIIPPDTIPPSFSKRKPSDNKKVKQGTVAFGCHVEDNVRLANVSLFIYNSSGHLVETRTIATNSSSYNAMWNIYLAHGTYFWSCGASDWQGNTNTSSNFTLIVDGTPPTVPAPITYVGPGKNKYATTTNLAFCWSPSTDPETGVASYYFRLLDIENLSTPLIVKNVTGLCYNLSSSEAAMIGEGKTYLVKVAARNTVGLTSDDANLTITVDTQPPSPVLDLILTSAINTTLRAVKLDWTIPTDNVSGLDIQRIYRRQCLVPLEDIPVPIEVASIPPHGTPIIFPWTNIANVSNTTSMFIDTHVLHEGYEYYVAGVDIAGNEQEVGNTPCIFANIPPVGENVRISPLNPTSSDTLTCSADYSDGDGDAERGSLYSWYVNGVNIANGSTLSASLIKKNDTVMCSYTPSDGYVMGETVNSSEIVIRNSPLQIRYLQQRGVVLPYALYSVLPPYAFEIKDKDLADGTEEVVVFIEVSPDRTTWTRVANMTLTNLSTTDWQAFEIPGSALSDGFYFVRVYAYGEDEKYDDMKDSWTTYPVTFAGPQPFELDTKPPAAMNIQPTGYVNITDVELRWQNNPEVLRNDIVIDGNVMPLDVWKLPLTNWTDKFGYFVMTRGENIGSLVTTPEGLLFNSTNASTRFGIRSFDVVSERTEVILNIISANLSYATEDDGGVGIAFLQPVGVEGAMVPTEIEVGRVIQNPCHYIAFTYSPATKVAHIVRSYGIKPIQECVGAVLWTGTYEETPQTMRVVRMGQEYRFYLDEKPMVRFIEYNIGWGWMKNLTNIVIYVRGEGTALLSNVSVTTARQSAWVELSEGTHTICGVAYDDAGNANSTCRCEESDENESICGQRIIVDITPPAIQMRAPQNGSTQVPGITLEFNITDAYLDASGYRISGSLSANGTFNESWDISTTGWPDGLYVITVWARDMAGNYREENYTIVLSTPTSPTGRSRPPEDVPICDNPQITDPRCFPQTSEVLLPTQEVTTQTQQEQPPISTSPMELVAEIINGKLAVDPTYGPVNREFLITLLTLDGKPLKNIPIKIVGPEGSGGTVTTNGEGKASYIPLREGRYVVSAQGINATNVTFVAYTPPTVLAQPQTQQQQPDQTQTNVFGLFFERQAPLLVGLLVLVILGLLYLFGQKKK